jgi:PAS domain S-box-containing protein
MSQNLFNLDFSRWNEILFSIVPAAINIGIFLYVSLFLPQKRLNNSFSVFVFLLGLWQLSHAFIGLSITEEEAYEWIKTGEVLLTLLIPFGIIFVLNFSGWIKKIPNNLLFPVVFLPTIVSLFIITKLNEFPIEKSVYWHWVSNPKPTFYSFFIYGWFAVGTGIILTLLWLYYASIVKNKLKRKSAFLLALGFSIPAIAGLIFEIAFPLVFKLGSIPVTASLVTFFSIASLVSITKYKFLEFSPKYQWNTIAESINEGILIVNNNDQIMYANRMFCKITGYNYEEISGKEASKLFFDTPEQIKLMEQVIEERKDKKTSNYEVQAKTKSGSVFSNQITITDINILNQGKWFFIFIYSCPKNLVP